MRFNNMHLFSDYGPSVLSLRLMMGLRPKPLRLLAPVFCLRKIPASPTGLRTGF